MFIRHANHVKSVDRLSSIIDATNDAIRQLIQNKPYDLDALVVTLVNTHHHINLLKQHSGGNVIKLLFFYIF